jgi:putative transposase
MSWIANSSGRHRTGPGRPDITYIPTREGWLHLAAAEYLYSRRIVGWSMPERIESRLVVDDPEMAVDRRRPGEGVIAHSGRGGRYASERYRGLLAGHGITCSMSRRANGWDDAPMESSFAGPKNELAHDEGYQTWEEARASLFESIEVSYN